jgi:hypothetical protein
MYKRLGRCIIPHLKSPLRDICRDLDRCHDRGRHSYLQNGPRAAVSLIPPEGLRDGVGAKPFGPLAKAIFSSLEFRTGIIRSNHAIRMSTRRTEGRNPLPSLSQKGGSLQERRDVSPRSLQDPFYKCRGLSPS